VPGNEILTTVLNSVPFAITSIDPDGAILFVNDGAAVALSSTPAAAVGTSLFDYFPERAAALRERIRQTVAARSVQHFDAVVTLPDGRERYYDSAYCPALDEHGDVVAVQIVAHDITDLRTGPSSAPSRGPDWARVTDDLSMTDDRVKAILANAAMIITVYDTELRIRYMNRVLPGIELADVIGQSPMRWLTDSSQQVLRRTFARVLDTQQVAECELEGLSQRTWLVRLAPLVYRDQVQQVIACTLDITEQKRLQAQLADKQRIESLGTMARGIAHDFNNLLTAIMGDAGLIRRKLSAGEDPTPLLEEIEAASRRAADLCDQMLDYAGKDRSTSKPSEVNPTIEEMAALTRAAASAKISVTYDLAEGLPATRCSRAQVGQVVLNLINNAADAIGDECGSIRVSTVEIVFDRPDADYLPEPPPPGRYIRLRVADSGHGVAARDHHLLFDPFYSTKVSGHGLGLSVVLGILSSYGGAISVCSREGEGTTMTVLLPVYERDVTPRDADAGTEEWPTGEGTVLVVDDELSVRHMIAGVLADAGYDVLQAGDGDEALAMFAQHAPSIRAVILDVTMPHRDGHDTLEKLRERDRRVPVLLSSGRPIELPAGDPFVRLLPKPYGPGEILRAIARDIRAPARD